MVVERPSPNHTERRGVAAPDMVVLHYTGMESAEAAIERLCDPVAEVSAHYVIDLDGTVTRLVAEDRRAWHAGRAAWGGVADVNSHAVGIEIVNPGHALGYPPFPEAQMDAVERVLRGVVDRWGIAARRVVGHACVAPGRKIDPGEKFDWQRLAQRGLAVWLPFRPERAAGHAENAARFQRVAARIGYPCPDGGAWDAETLAVYRAFAMRFVPGFAADPPRADVVAHAGLIAERWPVQAD